MMLTQFLSRVLRHVGALGAALAGLVIWIVASMFIGWFVDPFVHVAPWVASSLWMFVGAAVWMAAANAVNGRYPEAGVIGFLVGAALAHWLMPSRFGHASPLFGLFEFQSACLGGCVATYLISRRSGGIRWRTCALAVVLAIVVPLFELRFRKPGELKTLTSVTGEETDFHIWGSSDSWAGMSHAWRESEEPMDEFWNIHGYSSDSENAYIPIGLLRVADEKEVAEVLRSCRLTEERLVEKELSEGTLAPFMRSYWSLRKEWRSGALWTIKRRWEPRKLRGR